MLAPVVPTGYSVTVTKPTHDRPACAWCRRPLLGVPTAGRPRLYCAQPCRQRAYEARRKASSVGVGAGQVVVRKSELDRLHDRLYELEAALEDVEMDLADGRTQATLSNALDHLFEVASRLRHFVIDPVTD